MLCSAKLNLVRLLLASMPAVCIQASVRLGNASRTKISASQLSKRFSPEELAENTLEPAHFRLGDPSTNDLSPPFDFPDDKLATPADHVPHDDKIVFGKIAAHIREEPMRCWTCPKKTREDACNDSLPHNALNGPSACTVLLRGWGTDLCLRYPSGFRVSCLPKLRTPCVEECTVENARLSSFATGGSSLSLPCVLLQTVLLPWLL